MDKPLRRFFWLYPLANAGSHVAFLPLLTLIVPLQVAGIAGAGKVALLSTALVAGVLMATVANVTAGAASDWTFARWGTRRPWLWVGIAGSGVGYAMIVTAETPVAVLFGVVLFQLAFNLFYGPFVAIFADTVPDRFKGRTSALLTLALPMGSLVTACVGSTLFSDNVARIIAVAAIALLGIAPLLAAWPRGLAKAAEPALPDAASRAAIKQIWGRFLNLWVAKFLVQLSGNVVPAYFLFYLDDVVGREKGIGGSIPSTFAIILTIATLATAVLSIAVARWSDRAQRRRPFMLGALVVMAGGLLCLALGHGPLTALAGYAGFSMGLGAFLTIDLALVAQILPSRLHRGRDMGIMNGANTLPAVLGPLLALAVLGSARHNYAALFLILVCALALSGTTLLLSRNLR